MRGHPGGVQAMVDVRLLLDRVNQAKDVPLVPPPGVPASSASRASRTRRPYAAEAPTIRADHGHVVVLHRRLL